MVNLHSVTVQTTKQISLLTISSMQQVKMITVGARYDTLPKVTFSYPEIGSVGLTEAEAIKAGYNVGVGRTSTPPLQKAMQWVSTLVM